MNKIHLVSILWCILSFVSYETHGETPPDSICYVHFINVGQGDATLLEFSHGAILIDAGAQDQNYVDSLTYYLGQFFDKHPHLGDTLLAVMITHDHPDHTKGLREVIDSFYVERLIYNGFVGSRGDLNWAVNHPDEHDANLIAVSYEDVIAGDNKLGLTNEDIDPIVCGDFDPVITLLSGGFEENPGWSHSSFDNDNNHSMVIRLDFQGTSFLFTGDLEEEGIDVLLHYYYPDGIGDGPFNADIYHVGHHGSQNATTEELLEAVSPEVAIIPVGAWTYGKGTNNRFTTYWYGHPRLDVVKLLTKSLPKKKRSPLIKPELAQSSANFKTYKVKKKIYATAWDGNIKIKVMADGRFTVYRKRKP